MKKFILPILSLFIAQNTFATSLLVPSLDAQMKKQAIVDKNRFAIERQIRNEMRMAELRNKAKQKLAQSTVQKPQNTSPTPPKPQIQVASQSTPQPKLPATVVVANTQTTQSTIA
jgi:hypothetical protein